MVYEVALTEKANQDLEDIYNFIVTEYNIEESAKEIVSDIISAIQSLSEFPFRCRQLKYEADFRILNVRNFSAVYRIEEYKVIVLTIKATRYLG